VTLRDAGGRAFPVGLSTRRLTHEVVVSGVVAVFQDLSEIREMERIARRNQTLAEVGALAAGIAHELRNGLKPISGSVEVLQRELTLEGENAQLMELVSRESARLNRFVTDLLSYAREREVAHEAIVLDVYLRELVGDLRRDPRCVPGITLRAELEEAAGVVLHADRDQLRQVWLNLAANAFEAVGPRGTLVVRATPGADGRLTVTFEDDGPGIAAEHLPRVGEPFFTTKHGGTGLGLAIATRIVEHHGGTLSLDSAPGRGTRVHVTLPDAQPAMAMAA
jgi:two-component system sensor histidine kinase PilS (NtrC family)